MFFLSIILSPLTGLFLSFPPRAVGFQAEFRHFIPKTCPGAALVKKKLHTTTEACCKGK